MKKKLIIVSILVLVMSMLFSCKTKESTEQNSDNETTIEKVIVEDEVTVDFGAEQDKQTKTDDKEDGATVGGNSGASGNSVDNGTTDNDDVPTDSDTNSEAKPDDSDRESEEPENPYDKDGDGYVDGWY